MLAEMWMSVANNGEWQKVFKHLCADDGEAPATPKKSNKGGKHEGEQGEGEQGEGEQDDEPTTPPYKPDRPLRVVVSGNPKPVSLGAPSEKPAPKLKTRE